MSDNLDFFSINEEEQLNINKPLAARLRPDTLEKFVGQQHLIGEDKPLYRMIKADKVSSLIFYGPPGTGKTTLANIIAKTTRMNFIEISATSAGVKDIKNVIERAKENISMYSIRTMLFIDEIHRFNKSQQDTLLPHVENGLITLIGATTENPYFEVNKALISRMHVLKFEKFSDLDLRKLIKFALEDKINGYGKKNIEITEDAINYLIISSGRDARMLLNSLEVSILSTPENDGKILLTVDVMKNSIIGKVAIYDKSADEHYDTISAFIKSMRGSDPNAALYYLSKMLVAGEDIKFIARRIIIFASEDIGLADPNALVVANSTFESINIVGMPESRIILSNAVVYMCLAPKSNSTYIAINNAMDFVKNNKLYDIPIHLRDAHYEGAKSFEHGIDYKYPHDYENHWINQQYLPEEISDIKFYNPSNQGLEKILNEKYEDRKSGGKNGNKNSF